ncbi:MAG: PD40 domain-containing protein [Anaerolineae bacterium]|nr:PD40 domain-containing protein [Anaerolineae bacterium]
MLIGLLAAATRSTRAQTSIPVDQLAVTAVDEIPNLKKPGVGYLSSDGMWIAFADGKSLCIYTSAGEKQHCIETPLRIDFNSIRWSPDSTRVAYTEDFFRTFRDSDIWVMDSATGKATDLTDDGAFKFNLRPPQDADPVGFIDAVPRWSSDGKRLAFIRYMLTFGNWQPYLYTVDANGGTPKEGGILTGERFGIYALAWSPDGKQIAYNRGISRNQGDQNGMWVADLEGKNARQILSVKLAATAEATPTVRERARVAIPMNIEYSPDGRSLLAFDPAGLGEFTARWEDFTSSRVFTVDGSGSTPVDADEVAHWAGWSPTGTALVYIARSARNPDVDGLYVVEKPGAQGRKIYSGRIVLSGNTWRPLEWASNNTILVFQPEGGGKFLLLHLGAKS